MVACCCLVLSIWVLVSPEAQADWLGQPSQEGALPAAVAVGPTQLELASSGVVVLVSVILLWEY